MKKVALAIGILILIFLGGTIYSRKTMMTITSTAFANNQPIPSRYTCDGENVNPPLAFSDIPPNTKSLVLIVDDPDAPGGTWTHWVVFNMPANTKEIKEKSSPPGTEGVTSFGKPGYGGPCPPSGTHRYVFKLFALDAMLSTGDNPDKKTVEALMQNHILVHSELIGVYGKRQ